MGSTKGRVTGRASSKSYIELYKTKTLLGDGQTSEQGANQVHRIVFNARAFPGVLPEELNIGASFRSHSLILVEVVVVVAVVVVVLSSSSSSSSISSSVIYILFTSCNMSLASCRLAINESRAISESRATPSQPTFTVHNFYDFIVDVAKNKHAHRFAEGGSGILFD